MFHFMSLYNNFDDDFKADVLWKKIESMFETKNGLNRVESIFRKIDNKIKISGWL